MSGTRVWPTIHFDRDAILSERQPDVQVVAFFVGFDFVAAFDVCAVNFDQSSL